MKTDSSNPTKIEIFEIAAIAITGIMKYVMVDLLEIKFWFILMAATFWIGYLSIRISKDRSLINKWGLTLNGFGKSLRVLTVPALLVLTGSIWYGLETDVLIFNWHIIPVLVLYPLWGTIQQLLVISIFGGNLYQSHHSGMKFLLLVFLTSVLFSAVHYPSLALMIATFFLALVYCTIYFKFKNIIVLGLFHGWLACVFYFFVLGRDPWLEFVGSM